MLGISAVSRIFFSQKTVYKLGQRTESEIKIIISALAAFVNQGPSSRLYLLPLTRYRSALSYLKPLLSADTPSFRRRFSCHTERSLGPTLSLAWTSVLWLPTTPGFPGT